LILPVWLRPVNKIGKTVSKYGFDRIGLLLNVGAILRQRISRMSYENIIAEVKGNVGLITLNRPQALNALCAALITDIGKALD